MKVIYVIEFQDKWLWKETKKISEVIKHIEDTYFTKEKITIRSYDEDDIDIPIWY